MPYKSENLVTIEVCVGSACHLKGSYNVINKFQSLVKENKLENKVQIKAVFCMGNCTKPVSVRLQGGEIFSANMDNIEEFFKNNVMSRI